MLTLAVISTRTTVLQDLWIAVLVCAIGFVLAVIIGVLFRSRWAWGIAVYLLLADLLLGVAAAVTDRLGYGPK